MTHKTGDPTPRPDLPALPADVLVDDGLSDMYRLGDDTRNRETLADGKRILSWRIRGDDVQLAELAGWEDEKIFPMTIEGETGHLYLPTGTRNAHSILSGTEAWSGEKRAVVERVGQYLRDIHARFGVYDTDFSWKQVGITPDQDIFIAPPNTPVATVSRPAEPAQPRQAWQEMVVEELGILLQGDGVNAGLVESFTQGLPRG